MFNFHACSLTGSYFIALDWYTMVFGDVWGRLNPAPEPLELCVLHNGKHGFKKNASVFNSNGFSCSR